MISLRYIDRVALLRWSARIGSVLLTALVLTFFVGESLAGEGPVLARLSLTESLEFLAMAGMLIGGLLGFWREIEGGWLCLLAGTLFNLVESWTGGGLSLFWLPTAYMLIGVGYLLAQAGNRQRDRHAHS